MNWPDLGSGVYRQHGRHGRFVLGRWDQQGPRAGPTDFSLRGGDSANRRRWCGASLPGR
jgi:hypothetical protein